MQTLVVLSNGDAMILPRFFFQINICIPCDEVTPCISSIKSTRHVQLLACCNELSLLKI